jgi:hypothetical protein
MDEHVRMNGRNMETPIRCYVHPDSGRRIWLVGTVHFGMPGYYEDIKAAVTEIVEAGAVVHHEYTALVETMKNLPPDVTQQERDVLDAELEHGRLTDIVVGHGRWVDQVTGLGGWPEGWQRVDLDHLEVIRLAGPEVMLNALRASIATLEFALTNNRRRKRYVVSQWLALRLAASGASLPEAPTDHVVVDCRNEVALDGVDSTDRDLVLVWGSDHLPGLAEGLDKRGFALDYETWHVVGRMPSYWWLPVFGAVLVCRNVFGLPGSPRYARKMAMAQMSNRVPETGP